jgi:hypothetical protein
MNLETCAGRKWPPSPIFVAMSETNVAGGKKNHLEFKISN